MKITEFSTLPRVTDINTRPEMLFSEFWRNLTEKELSDIFSIIFFSNFDLNDNSQLLKILKIMATLLNSSEASFLSSDINCQEIDDSNILSIGMENKYLERLPESIQLDLLADVLHPNTITCKIPNFILGSCDAKQRVKTLGLQTPKDQHVLLTFLRVNTELYGIIVLGRNKGQRDFSEKDEAICRFLAPYIANALRSAKLSQRTSRMDNNKGNMTRKARSRSLLILDRDLRIRHCDPIAKLRCLKIYEDTPHRVNEVTDDEIKIPHEIIQDCIALEKMFYTDMIYVPASVQRFVTTKQNEQLKINTSVEWVHVGSLDYPFFMVSLKLISEVHDSLEIFLRESFQLTKREVDIVEGVNKGLSNDEISKELFISRNTVETHLKHIFQKTNVRNRLDLNSLINFY